MVIKFKCKCGQIAAVKEEWAGKRTKCPGCGRLLTIPPPLPLSTSDVIEPEPAPSGAARESKCPTCGETIAAAAVICLTCGFDVRTGSMTPKAPEAAGGRGRASRPRAGRVASSKDKRGPSITIPTRKIVIVTVIGLVVVGLWFLVVVPINVGLKMSGAYSYVKAGDLHTAIEEFKKLREEVHAENREQIDLWIDQCNLELVKNAGLTLSDGIVITSDALQMTLEKKRHSGGGILVGASIRNTGQRPLELRNDFFHLRGSRDIVPLADHTENTLDGVIVPPGESADGILAFRSIPLAPAYPQEGRSPYFYMSFNDGKTYVKCWLPY